VKEHLLLSPTQQVPVSSLNIYLPIVATPTISLAALLNEFQVGSSHMAFIAKDPLLLRSALLRHPVHASNKHHLSGSNMGSGGGGGDSGDSGGCGGDSSPGDYKKEAVSSAPNSDPTSSKTLARLLTSMQHSEVWLTEREV
jgi:hypothetical protein